MKLFMKLAMLKSVPVVSRKSTYKNVSIASHSCAHQHTGSSAPAWQGLLTGVSLAEALRLHEGQMKPANAGVHPRPFEHDPLVGV